MRKGTRHRITALLLALALMVSLLPYPATATAESSSETQKWSDDIPALLAAGEYVEGEAIVALVNLDESGLSAQSELPVDGFETLMTVDSDDALAQDGVGSEASGLLSAQSEQDDAVTISIVSSDTMSTEELLYALAEEEQVLFAEPNYLTTPTENEEDGEADAAVDDEQAAAASEEQEVTVPSDDTEEQVAYVGSNADELALVPEAESSVADLTPLQWGCSNNTTVRTSNLNDQAPSSSANVPNFGTTTPNMDQEVVVAVFDGAVDYRNPDLANVMRHFSSDEMQSLGCGEWGYNASDKGGQSADGFIFTDHATHCAGVIGAEWDGKGISGAASKARIVSIQVSDPVANKSYITSESVLRGYAFVDKYNSSRSTDAEKVRVCSLSISLPHGSRALSAAVAAVGKKYGTVSVFSAGNDAYCNDSMVRASNTLRQNQYALVVASTDIAGNLSTFSNWGKETTTLGAPGTGILSTITMDSAAYFPDAALGTSGSILYEGFEGSSYNFALEQVNSDFSQRVSPSCNLTQNNMPRFAGNYATNVPINASLCDQSDSGIVAHFYLELDVTDCFEALTNSTNIQFGIAFSGLGNSVKCLSVQDSKGTTLPLKRNDDISTGGWASATANLTGATISTVETDSGNRNKLGLIINIFMDESTTTLGMDSIGIGTVDAPYTMMDGTSMATPLVAGCTAVYAAKHPTDSGAALAARVCASVKKTTPMANITTTGGIVDLGTDNEGTVEEVKPVTPTFSVYEQTLPLDTSTGSDPYTIDGTGDLETYGPLTVVDGTLYYLPSRATIRTDSGSVSLAYHDVLAFDIASSTWVADKATSLPDVTLANISTCAYDGKLWVMGGEATMSTTSEGQPLINPDGATRIFSYDPQSKQWAEASSTGLNYWADMMLFADSTGLKIFDAGESNTQSSAARSASTYSYDPKQGLGTKVAAFDQAITIPSIASHDGKLYAIDNNSLTKGATELTLFEVNGSNVSTTKVTIPKVLYENRSVAGIESDSYGDQNIETNVSLLAGKNALYLVGHTDVDKTADTWTLPYGETTFTAYGKHLAATRPVQTTAALCNGKIYAIASAWGEQDGRIFRATQVETIDLSGATVALEYEATAYTGSALTPSVTVTLGGAAVPSDGYDVSYSDNTGVGTATVTVTGKGTYTGSASKTFQITAADLSGATVALEYEATAYTGSALTPSVTVTLGGKELAAGTDYDVSYADNTGVGTATVTVTGKGSYTGTASKTFQITEAKPSVVFIDVDENTPHQKDILWLAAQGISTGWPVGEGQAEFRGMSPVVRQDMAAFLYRLAGSPTYVPTPADVAAFVDVDSTNPDVSRRTPHYTEILWLWSSGISRGWDMGGGVYEFRGMDTVKRQDMAAFLRRLAKHMGADAKPTSGGVTFSDVGEATPHYEDILWLSSAGVTEGWDMGNGTFEFRGMNDVVRQDMAAFLRRLYDYVKKPAN